MSTTLVRRYRSGLVQQARRLRASAEHGMTTAEYAVGTIAACALAGVLFTLVSSNPVKELVFTLIKSALKVPGK